MLKKIKIEELRLGMHLHELCGNWLDHPFWRTKFVLRDGADLVKLRQSGVTECWIDNALGLDVKVDEPALPRPKTDAPRVSISASNADSFTAAQRPATASREEESPRAAAAIANARKAVESLFGEARLGRALQTEQCAELVDQVASSVWRNPEAIVSLSRLKTHDNYSYMHSVAVCALMISLARQMNMDEATSRKAGMAGLLHDMGKALMPLEVLNKPGKLTDEEFEIMRGHPKLGHELLLTGDAVDEMALDVCLHHHEKVDGSGYPFGLAGDQISTIAKMGAVCDVYDAISSHRPYKAAWDPAESISRMAGWAKGHFDDCVFKQFVTSLGIYPTGALVRLKSGLLAVVVEQNAASILAPKVKVFFSTKSNMPVPLRVLDLCDTSLADRIVCRESNDEWQFKHLDELWAGAEVVRKIHKAA